MEIHKQESYDIEFIESLIINEIEESINIDFKSADALDKADKKKQKFQKTFLLLPILMEELLFMELMKKTIKQIH